MNLVSTFYLVAVTKWIWLLQPNEFRSILRNFFVYFCKRIIHATYSTFNREYPISTVNIKNIYQAYSNSSIFKQLREWVDRQTTKETKVINSFQSGWKFLKRKFSFLN